MENIPLASQKVTLPSRDSASSFQPEIFLGTRWFQALLARSWSDSDTRVSPGDVGTPVCAKPTPPSLLGGGEKEHLLGIRGFMCLTTSILPLLGLKSEMWTFL